MGIKVEIIGIKEEIMANKEWGPLAGLIGNWEGDQGLDVSFHNDAGKVAETPYREKTSFKPFGPVDNGRQCLYGLDYRTAAWRGVEENPFHTEIGYWMWDAADQQVMRCFLVPRASAVIAGALVAPDARVFTMSAEIGSNVYGILSNKYLDASARTTRFDVTVTVNDDTFSYDETTVVEHQRTGGIIMHTDRNTLRLICREG